MHFFLLTFACSRAHDPIPVGPVSPSVVSQICAVLKDDAVVPMMLEGTVLDRGSGESQAIAFEPSVRSEEIWCSPLVQNPETLTVVLSVETSRDIEWVDTANADHSVWRLADWRQAHDAAGTHIAYDLKDMSVADVERIASVTTRTH